MKKIIPVLFCILALLITACDSRQSENKERTIDSIMKENNYIIVDVRTKEEYDIGHVKGAINIPYDVINSKDNLAKLDKNKTIVVYCRSGKRSDIAYNTLKDLGYDVFDLGAYESTTLEKE